MRLSTSSVVRAIVVATVQSPCHRSMTLNAAQEREFTHAIASDCSSLMNGGRHASVRLKWCIKGTSLSVPLMDTNGCVLNSGDCAIIRVAVVRSNLCMNGRPKRLHDQLLC